MRRTMCALLMVALAMSASPGSADNNVAKDTKVYVCTGPNAKKYHRTPDCRGLRRCSGEVVEMSLEEAQRTKSPCRICY